MDIPLHGGKSLANPPPTLPKSAAIPRKKVRDRFFILTNLIPDLPRWYPIHTDLWSLDCILIELDNKIGYN